MGGSRGKDDEGDDDDGEGDGNSVRGAVGAAADYSDGVGVDDAGIARDPISVAIVGMQVWWGAGNVRGFGLNMVSVEGVHQMLKRGGVLCHIGVCRVTIKNGGKVVGWVW